MIKEGLIFILLIGATFALNDTPVQEVIEHNLAIKTGMMGTGKLTLEKLTSVVPSAVNMTIVDVLPSVDNRIPPETTGVLWAWNENNAGGTTIIEYDSHKCVDRYMFTLLNRSKHIEMEFGFKGNNITKTIGDGDPIIEIPFDSSLLESANGSENLSILLKWNYYYKYEVIISNSGWTCNGNPPHCSCEDQGSQPPVEKEITVTGETGKQYVVESGKVTFFLLRPVLEEQWYQNNHFDTLLFSRKSIYRTEILLDGGKRADARIYDFNISEDKLGAWHITTNDIEAFENASMENYEISYWATPVVWENNSFSHLYETNYSYSGVGAHNLTIVALDFFGGKHTFEKKLYSRKISYNGRGEGGKMAENKEEYRPSAPEMEKGILEHNQIPTNEYIMFFLVASIGIVWYYKGQGKSR